MIDEKKIIDNIKEYRNNLKPEYIAKLTDAVIEDIIDIINEQPKIDWIRCEDELPPYDESVYVTIHGTDIITFEEGETFENDFFKALERNRKRYRRVQCATLVRDSDSEGNEWDDWIGPEGYPLMVAPVAWMPMPSLKPFEE